MKPVFGAKGRGLGGYFLVRRSLPTDFLFAQPSFLAGIARTPDLFALLDDYNRCRTPEEADAMALYTDWHNVGDDLRNAIVCFDEREKDNWKPVQTELPLPR